MNGIIEEVKCGVQDGGIACGPVDGAIVAEIRIKAQEKISYYSLAEVTGIPNFYKSDESLYDSLMDTDIDDETIKKINRCFLEIGEYDEVFENSKEIEDFPILRYLIYLVRADWDEVENLKVRTIGRDIADIIVPASDVEEEYMEELED